jgi:putative tricarboxylic transport membrane protein
LEILNNLLLGLATAASVNNLLFCLAGVTLGTVVGVLPGLGPMAALSILLPITYHLGDPVGAIIFMAGIYYGTQYGGSTTSILMKLPGEASSVVTTLDGYAMTQRGRGGAALAIAALASFLGGTVATLLIALIGEPLAEVAFLFGPAEYTALMIMGLVASVSLSQGSFVKGLGMVLLGVLLGSVGTDINSGMIRFSLGIPQLTDGISFGIIAMAMFGLAEILYNSLHERHQSVIVPKLRELYPTRQELKESVNPAVRGTILGSILGLLPGGGAILSSFASYALEKKISKTPEQFGQGAVAGVAGPEAANNAGAQTGFIPMLSMGLPVTPIMALMAATLIIHNIQPGPQVMTSNPALIWGLIVSMWIGNALLVVLNLPLVGVWVNLLKIPKKILYPMIVIVCAVGAYHINNSWFDVMLLIPFALIGYVLKALDCEPAPLAMGFVVGSMFEEFFRRAMSISQGNFLIFVEKPISLTFLILTAILLLFAVFWKRKHV